MNMVIIAIVFLLPFFIATILSVILFKRYRRGYRSPLTSNLLRGAGESLRVEIDKTSESVDTRLFLMFFISFPAVLLFWSLVRLNTVPQIWQLLLPFVLYVSLIIWATRNLFLLLKHRSNLYLGLDAEIAVGQELNQLMRQGCRVYHDFPAEEFNIDHVVAGPGGVYAVETKGRSKPNKGRGNLDAKVIYDGETLRFPDWHEDEPIKQAKRQAVWLSKWLTSAVGTEIKVTPVLTLPGWFVERTKSGSVLVFNGKSPSFLAKPQGRTPLDEQLIQQIAHQLEQRCRDVEPVGYRKRK